MTGDSGEEGASSDSCCQPEGAEEERSGAGSGAEVLERPLQPEEDSGGSGWAEGESEEAAGAGAPQCSQKRSVTSEPQKGHFNSYISLQKMGDFVVLFLL